MYYATLSKRLPHLSHSHLFWKADIPTCVSLSVAPHGYKSQCSSLGLPLFPVYFRFVPFLLTPELGAVDQRKFPDSCCDTLTL